MSVASARPGQRGARYRRRRPIPALVVLVILVLASGFMWTRVFETRETTETATQCNAPTPSSPQAPAPALGQMLPRSTLDQTALVPPQDIGVRVLNANGESKQAGLISDELSSLGFGQGPPAGNDPVYKNYDLNCHGQIRFGGAGAGEARTLSLMAPCSQLVRDERMDSSVDLALGGEFDDIKTTPEAKQVMQQLKNWVAKRGQQGGAEQEVTPPKISKNLLTEARDVSC